METEDETETNPSKEEEVEVDTVLVAATTADDPTAEEVAESALLAVNDEEDEDVETANERLKKELEECLKQKTELEIENSNLREEVEHLKAQVLAMETTDSGKVIPRMAVAKSPNSRGIKRTAAGSSKLTPTTTPKAASSIKLPATEPIAGKRAIKWDARFEQLQDFHKEHGHVNLSKRNAPADLVVWVNDQRTQHRLLREGHYSTMTADRIQRLRGLGFQFTVTKSPPLPWEERFVQLKAYKETHNHCNVQQLCQSSPAGLGNWVLEQRRKYKLLQEGRTRGTKVGTLTPERIAKLEELGFQWKLRDRNDKRTRKSDGSPAATPSAKKANTANLTPQEEEVLAAAQQLANAVSLPATDEPTNYGGATEEALEEVVKQETV